MSDQASLMGEKGLAQVTKRVQPVGIAGSAAGTVVQAGVSLGKGTEE